MSRGTAKLALNGTLLGFFLAIVAPTLATMKVARNMNAISDFDIVFILSLIFIGLALMAFSLHAVVDRLPELLDD